MCKQPRAITSSYTQHKTVPSLYSLLLYCVCIVGIGTTKENRIVCDFTVYTTVSYEINCVIFKYTYSTLSLIFTFLTIPHQNAMIIGMVRLVIVMNCN